VVISITKDVLAGIMAHAEETYPEECCGLLIATGDKRVVETMRMTNSFPGPRNDRYHIDPLALYKADRTAAQRGLYIAGIYHSHPDYPASLSKYDLEHSFPWYSYLVVSVPKGRAGDFRSWLPNDDRTEMNEEPVDVSSGGA
jgi:proteasome lid subunit RPN8/RPN11